MVGAGNMMFPYVQQITDLTIQGYSRCIVGEKAGQKPVKVSSNPTYIEVLRDLFYHVLPITLLRVFYGFLLYEFDVAEIPGI